VPTLELVQDQTTGRPVGRSPWAPAAIGYRRGVLGDTRESRLLPAEPSSVPDARRAIRSWLSEAGFHELVDEAELAVSEVVTNALVHTGTPVELSASIESGLVRVEVADGSSQAPCSNDFDTVSGTGRGLKVLEQTVARWGVEPRGTGKVVWFELGGGTGSGEVEPEAAPAEEEIVHIRLLAVPLLLMSAWLDHAGALLRDCLLLDLEVPGADSAEALRRHALASALLARVRQQLPRLEPSPAPDELLAGATEPQVTMPQLDFHVSADQVAMFPILGAALDRARQLAVTGVLLTPPTQPEIQELLHWLTGEVARQAVGGAPRPWAASMSSRSSLEIEPLVWDESSVEQATTPVVATDDYDVIVAASAPALELLGHTRNALVGRRTLAIIPPRYRQAHLAGFTLHQVNGRGPLLDATVTLPVLRADGTERMVEMAIRAQPLPRGRTVFLASFDPVPDTP
jgi:PAS domain S-box-containing protein